MSRIRLWASLSGILIATLVSAADYWLVAAISRSPQLGRDIYAVRFLGFPGILFSAVFTGIISGNPHGGSRSDLAYFLVAFTINSLLYGTIFYWLIRGVSRLSIFDPRASYRK
jgi:hypothetical protein